MMRLYRFSPIKSKKELLKAIHHIHLSSYALCKKSMGKYLLNAGNMGIFCHYDEEYQFLTTLRKELTEESNNVNQKYYKLHQPITIKAKGDIPSTTYTHLYIRKPDPHRAQVGDIDFYLEPVEYNKLKESIEKGKHIPGARVFDRTDLDMIELHDPDVDVLAYVSTKMMTQKVRIKQ